MGQETKTNLLREDFFQIYIPLDLEKIPLAINKSLLDEMIKNPKNPMGDKILNLSNDEIKDLKTLKKCLKEISRYSYSNNTRIGRVYHNSNIQKISSLLRKTLTYEYCDDLDIVNCHTILLLNIAKFHKLPCQELEKFVNQREELINTAIENGTPRNKIKQELALVVSSNICYNKDFLNVNYEIYHEILPELQNEYPEIIEYMNNLKYFKGEKSFIAFLLQSIENRIITMIYHYIGRENIRLILHDAVYVKKGLNIDIPVLEKYIEDNFYGFKLNLKLTDFSDNIMDDIFNLDLKEKELTPKDICDAYYDYTKQNGSKILFVNENFFICNSNNIWIKALIKDFRKILEQQEFNDFLMTQYNGRIHYSQSRNWDELSRFFKTDERYYVKSDFEFDNNPQLLAFDNNKCIVLDKFNKEKSWYIRDISPNDYISMNTKFALNFDDNLDTDYYNFCKSTITNMFQNSETAESYLMMLGSCIYGELLTKNIIICKGSGDNGKTFRDNLMRNVLGDYNGNFNRDFFTSIDFSDGEIKSPEAIENKNKRFISLSEPSITRNNKKCNFDCEKIKSYSGNDYVKARLLGSNKIENFINKALVNISLNTLLNSPNIDIAYKERMIIIPCDTQFVSNPIYDYHRQKLNDTTFIKTNKFKNHFIKLLLDYWELFVRNDLTLIISNQIQNYTSVYFNDFYDMFINNHYIKTNDKNDFITIEDIYDDYIDFFTGQYPLGKKSFIEKLISKRLQIHKIDKIINKERIQKKAVLYVKPNPDKMKLIELYNEQELD